MNETTRTTKSADETEALAEKLGAGLRGGEVIDLISDIGGGKTTFVRRLARGIGSQDAVASPTFTLSRIYQSEQITIHHYDLYRIQDAVLLEHELEEVLSDSQAIIVVEWSQAVQHVLPSKRITINMTAVDENTRKLHIQAGSSFAYIMERI
ncbi:MAG: tRNA (adenosine(37)-N6)-threonylcarbamoyltransferase complex ATPase subunit type 1 TsaE [Actinobacteria bacterium]|nr:tRNA (adenosine(37)-N6)-threonylcarbamoyltransferase complex ATPase subunit type 1 TsaE [Actinomycetota bacterium]